MCVCVCVCVGGCVCACVLLDFTLPKLNKFVRLSFEATPRNTFQ